ncbi:MAG: hypothetical protein CMK59_00020 [Proteobacteria bacterium]|nr:hypothetical protein [Pseudomonadota bacterium]
MNKIQCPSCGAEQKIQNPATVSLVCEYCSNIVVWDEAGLKLAGKESRLTEGFSRLFRGATGSVKGQRFAVVGRVRYSFGRGFWDEWYLALETGEYVWLTEDNHELALQKEIDARQEFKDFHGYSLGDELEIDGETFRVQELGMAKCLGLEGELPSGYLPDETYPYVDGSSLNGAKTFGLEFDEPDSGAAKAFVGTWVKPSELEVDENDYSW